jgi:hypothetical protein
VPIQPARVPGASIHYHWPKSPSRPPAPAGRSAPKYRSMHRESGPAFATHVCDVEVDPETGHVTVLRYTATQDVGRAIHPSYVEGQIQGGVAQGIGWALNEEYIYDIQGRLDNPGFLDYRVPVASDLPMIDAGDRRSAEPAASVWRPRRRCDCETCQCRRPRSSPRWTLRNPGSSQPNSTQGKIARSWTRSITTYMPAGHKRGSGRPRSAPRRPRPHSTPAMFQWSLPRR